MKAMLALPMLAGLLFAGCTAVDPADSGRDEIPGGQRLPARLVDWGLDDCTFGVALVSVPAAAVQPYLPPGFRSISLGEVGFGDVPNPTSDGNFGVELFECASGAGVSDVVDGMHYGSYFSAVETTDEYRREVTTHFVKWDVMVPDDDRRALLQSYGIPAVDGAAEFSTGHTGAAFAGGYRGTLTLNGTPVVSFVGAAVAPYDDGTFVEYTQTPGGLAEWRAKYEFLAGGLGPQVVTAMPGTFAAQLMGTEPQTGVGFAGKVRFVESTIQLPEQPS